MKAEGIIIILDDIEAFSLVSVNGGTQLLVITWGK